MDETIDQWWERQRAEFKQDGRNDADRGLFRLPYPGTDDPSDEESNIAYQRGFMERRKELGDKFEWK